MHLGVWLPGTQAHDLGVFNVDVGTIPQLISPGAAWSLHPAFAHATG